MRKLITTLVCLGCMFVVHSQQKDPATNFGKVTLEELQLKECGFDKSAGAMVLFDVAEAYGSFNIVQNVQASSAQLSSEVERHVRIKIFNEKGFRNADVHIIFWNLDQEIKNLEAQTYNLDESGKIVITKLEKKLVYQRKLVDKFISEQSFTFPDLRNGTVIEYKYRLTNKKFGIQNRWNFQGPIPVKFSRFEINFPEEFVVSVTPKCTLPLYQGSRVKDNRTIESYVMENVPALNPEPYMTTPDDYLQHVEPNIVALNYQGNHTNTIVPWISMIRELVRHEDFGGQLKKELPRKEELDLQLKKFSDPYQKMTTIYYYVRSNMTWDGVNTIWAPSGIKTAWKDKKGTAGEINLILVNLLKDAGLNANAVLVSTKENGRINAVHADMRQFDKVMAYVTLGDNIYILDATDKFTPPGLIPLDVSNTQGLLIADFQTFSWGWKKLWNQQQRFKNYALVKASINEKGELTGTAKITSMDYARIPRSADLKTGKDKFLDNYFLSTNPGVKLTDFVVENENVDSLPLLQSFSFIRPTGGSGDYRYFTLNMFSGLEKNEFIAQSRISDVFFGANQFFYISGSFTLPDNYSFDELPENIKMITPDTSIIATRRMNVNGNELGALVTVEFKKPLFTPEEYPDMMEFYKKLFDMLNEQIVIKKK